jgi:hypothetical protein
LQEKQGENRQFVPSCISFHYIVCFDSEDKTSSFGFVLVTNCDSNLCPMTATTNVELLITITEQSCFLQMLQTVNHGHWVHCKIKATSFKD